MKGNPPPEVLNIVPSHPCTCPEHPNHFSQPYAFHSISMPLGGVRNDKRRAKSRGVGSGQG